MAERLRVAQWATGSIGQIAIRHFVDNPAYDLAGVFVTNPRKVGTDAGDLAGIPATGVLATGDPDTLLALDLDCVHYAPLHLDVEQICRILRSGANVVTPCGFLFPIPSTADDIAAIQDAGRTGGTSLHGSGVHPGFVGDLLPLTFSRLMTRLEQVRMVEIADFRMHPSKQMMQLLGFGAEPDELADRLPSMLERKKAAYEPSLRMLASGLGYVVEDVTLDFEAATTKRDVAVRSGLLSAGTVAGMRFEWKAWVDGRPLVVFQALWRAGDDLDPSWDFPDSKYRLVMEGDPPIAISLGSAGRHPAGDEGYWGRVWTAMNSINAIPAVCAAPSGIVTHLDLGLVRGPNLARPRSADFGEPTAV